MKIPRFHSRVSLFLREPFLYNLFFLIIFSASEEKKEAIYVRRQRTALNRNGGYELAATFSHLLSRD